MVPERVALSEHHTPEDRWYRLFPPGEPGRCQSRPSHEETNEAVPPADLEPGSVVLRGSGAFVMGGHVVQVAAVFVATVV